MERNDFKLIAIRPLKNCDKKFSKVLEEEVYYYFYSGYKIENDKIVSKPEDVIDLYSNLDIKINITAILGKNGSGKSSLVELLYLTLFSVAVSANILPMMNDDLEPIKLENNLWVEVYYSINDTLYKITVKDKEVLFFDSKKSNNGNVIVNPKLKRKIKDLFYLVAINYSHHSLNRRNMGEWIKNVFHKNDGYQTPIVLNPFRKDGIIDINNEEYLTKSRIVSNLIVLKETDKDILKEVRTLAPNKSVTHIKIELDEEKIKKLFDVENKVVESVSKYEKDIISIIKSQFRITYKVSNVNNKDIFFRYLAIKLYNISVRYFANNYEYNFIRDGVFAKYKLIELVKFIKKDPSHISFKFKQAINYCKNVDFYEKNSGVWVEIDELNSSIKKLTDQKSSVIEYAPPSFFKFDLKFENNEEFSDLSSGEKQKIYSSTTYKYHLFNIDSVTKGRKYNNILLVFDEIELYFHPDLQRSFVNDFIKSIKLMNFKKINTIHCIMITHSPFILSDIPVSNILKMNDGKIKPIEGNDQTFGANINDILANDFFLNKGFIGEFAIEKINSLIDFITEQKTTEIWNVRSAEEFIKIIGEPLIRNELQELFIKAFYDIKRINEEIEKLNLMKIQKIEINDSN